MTDDPFAEFGPAPAIPHPVPKPRQPYRGGYTKEMRAKRELETKQAREALGLPRDLRTIKIPDHPKVMVHHPGRKPLPPSPFVTVQLQLQHSINGRSYGPGIVKCLPDQAAQFLSTESLCADKERSLVQQEAFIISFRDGCPVKKQVPWAQFDRIMGQTEVPLDIMGG